MPAQGIGKTPAVFNKGADILEDIFKSVLLRLAAGDAQRCRQRNAGANQIAQLLGESYDLTTRNSSSQSIIDLFSTKNIKGVNIRPFS